MAKKKVLSTSTYLVSKVDFQAYHSIPPFWTKDEVLHIYRFLGGKYLLETKVGKNPATPAWIDYRLAWLDYKSLLYEIAKGARAGDEACIELAIRYIELNYFGSYSGFIRARLARILMSQPLSSSQAKRLCVHFQNLIDSGQCFDEFREYNKLRAKLKCEHLNIKH